MNSHSIYTIINLQRLPSSDYRFTVTQRTSLGLNYYHGFRFMRDGRLLPPSIHVGFGHYKAIVILPDAALAAIRKKVINQIVKQDHADPASGCILEVHHDDTDSAVALSPEAGATNTPPHGG